MTTTQITSILSSINEEPNVLTDLDLVSSIMMYKNSSIYPTGHNKYIFDNDNEVLLEYAYNEEYDKNILQTVYDYSLIFGFTMADRTHRKGIHRLGVSN